MDERSLVVDLLEILVVFYGTAYLAFSSRNVKLYEYLALNWFSRFASKISPLLLTIGISGLISLTMDNDDVIMTLAPVLLALPLITKNKHLLVVTFVTANVFSLFSLVANPANIIAGTKFGLTFPDFAISMWMPASLIVGSIILLMLARYSSKTYLFEVKKRSKINRNQLFNLAAIVLMMILLIFQSAIGVATWMLIAFVVGIVLVRDILNRQSENILPRLPIAPAIIVVLGFGLLGVFEYLSVDESIASWGSGLNVDLLPVLFFIATILLSIVITNIPTTLIMASIALSLEVSFQETIDQIFVAIILGANLAALLHYRATLAGHLFIEMAADKVPRLKAHFNELMFLPALVSIVVSLLYLWHV